MVNSVLIFEQTVARVTGGLPCTGIEESASCHLIASFRRDAEGRGRSISSETATGSNSEGGIDCCSTKERETKTRGVMQLDHRKANSRRPASSAAQTNEPVACRCPWLCLRASVFVPVIVQVPQSQSLPVSVGLSLALRLGPFVCACACTRVLVSTLLLSLSISLSPSQRTKRTHVCLHAPARVLVTPPAPQTLRSLAALPIAPAPPSRACVRAPPPRAAPPSSHSRRPWASARAESRRTRPALSDGVAAH
eukprot:2148509-Pleurochrysis_carterae.AAC.5